MNRFLRSLCVIIIFGASMSVFAQGYQVKELKQNLNDGSAFHAPLDASGNPCGLVKVRIDDPDLHFSGSIVGEVENKLNEYFVYLEKGSKQLNVLHPNFMPQVIDFNAYGIDEVASKATYILTLRETKFKKDKCGVTLTLKPENAQLLIDDIAIDNLSGNGFYQLYLPKGDHVCLIAHEGYRSQSRYAAAGYGTGNFGGGSYGRFLSAHRQSGPAGKDFLLFVCG